MKSKRKWTYYKNHEQIVSEISGPMAEDDVFQVWVTKFEDFDKDGFPQTIVLELWQGGNEYSKPKKRAKKIETRRLHISNASNERPASAGPLD